MLLFRNMRDRLNDISSGMTMRSADLNQTPSSSRQSDSFLTPDLQFFLEEISKSQSSVQVCFQTKI